MDDEEYRAIRQELDPGEGYSFVLETIIAQGDSAPYTVIEEQFNQLNRQMEEADSEHRYDVDACLKHLEDEDLIQEQDDSYFLTERGEAFLREDVDDFDRYQESLQFSNAFNNAKDLSKDLQQLQKTEYDPDNYDLPAIEDYFIDQDNMDILFSFLEHPYEMPSTPEISFMTGRGEEEIENSLDTLQELDIIDKYPGIDDTSFYRLTDEAWSFLGEETGLLGPEPEETAATWKAIYAMVEKPDEIMEYESLPRPEA